MSAGMTTEQMSDSLTGFDEIAIKKFFGAPVSILAGNQENPGDPMQYLRSLVFVAERRDGKNDNEARNIAQSLTIKEVTDYFDKNEEAALDFDPDAPESESGKELAPTS